MTGLKLDTQEVLQALDAFSEGVLMTDAGTGKGDQQIIYVNKSFCSMTGYTEREVLGRNPRFLQGPETSELERAKIRRALKEGKPTHAVLTNYHKSGQPYDVELNIVPLRDKQGNIDRYLSIQLDVSDYTALETKDRVNEELYHQTLEGALDGTYILAPITDDEGTITDFRFVYINQAGYNLLSLGKEELIGKGLCETIPMNRTEGHFEMYKKVFETGEPSQLEFQADNAPQIKGQWISNQCVRIPGGIAIHALDITERKHDELRLMAKEQSLRSFLWNMPGPAWMVAEDGEIIDGNPAFQSLLKLEKVGGTFVTDIMPADEAQVYLLNNRKVIESGEVLHTIEPGPDVDGKGTSLAYQVVKFPLGEINGKRACGGFGFTLNDSSALVNMDELFTEIIATSDSSIIIMTPDGAISEWNQAAENLTGFSARDVKGRYLQEFMVPESKLPEFRLTMEHARQGIGTEGLRTLRKTRWGNTIPMEISYRPLRTADGTTVAVVSVARDLSSHARHESSLNELALQDPLTGLPNRAALLEHLAAGASEEEGAIHVLAIYSIEQLFEIRDIFGQEEYNSAVIQTANHIRPYTTGRTFIARISEDEFAISFTVGNREDANRKIAKYQAIMKEPFQSSFSKTGFDVHCGSICYMAGKSNADELLNRAHIANIEARRLHSENHVEYDIVMSAELERRLYLEQKLRHALEREEFHLVIQPVLRADGSLYGGECLLRWTMADNEVISPAEFVPVLEKTGGIVEIGYFVISEALRHADAVRKELGFLPTMALNISAEQLRDNNFVTRVKQLLHDAGIPAEALEFEITETMLMENRQHATQVMQDLADVGISWAIDDFGTGYSSLGYLKTLPADKLKIDRSFVMQLAESDSDRSLLQVITDLARRFDMRTVAEGVEEAEQFEILKAEGVELYQGYHFARPMPFDEFIEFSRKLGGHFVARGSKS
ncbi:MAG: EAL domain-containing protein [Gammaproteobacteria bacterium]|nr:EAL domain-containing protein [Gammaproteobacteria bacterium]